MASYQQLKFCRTLSRHVDDICAKERDSLKHTLIAIDHLGVTTDLWTHEDTSTPYITVTIHYITKVKMSCILMSFAFLMYAHMYIFI